MTSISLHRRLGILFVVMAIVCDCAVAGSPMDDFESAKRLAKRENRDIILSFSGYRWWWPAIGIDTHTEDPWIKKHFIMLEIEIPSNSEDSGGVVTAEDRALIELRKMFHQEFVEPGPTILLLDSDGRPYAEIDSNEQPAEVYLPDLKDAIQQRIKRDTAFRRGRIADGIGMAKLLNDGLLALDEIIVDGEVGSLVSQERLVDDYYQDVLADIIRNDPKDILGRGKELKEKKRWQKEGAEWRFVDELLASLATELNRMLDASTPLATYFSTIDKFLESHPAIPKEARQRALFGKVEAAIILRDYSAALKALDAMTSLGPELSSTKKLESVLRPELLKAIQLSGVGIDSAATAYSFRLTLSNPESVLDSDGKRTLAELKRLDENMGLLLVEDQMHRMLAKVTLLLRLRDYEQALRTLDAFVERGGSSKIVERRDRDLRPIIVRGLNVKSSGVSNPPKAEQ